MHDGIGRDDHGPIVGSDDDDPLTPTPPGIDTEAEMPRASTVAVFLIVLTAFAFPLSVAFEDVWKSTRPPETMLGLQALACNLMLVPGKVTVREPLKAFADAPADTTIPIASAEARRA